MKKQFLDGAWQFRQSNEAQWKKAQVPGCVHTDLLALGEIPDPFIGLNEKEVGWVAEADWEYRRLFTPDPSLLDMQRITLNCAGLDTLADVYLNGTLLGQADNMYIPWEWQMKGHLHRGENELRIFFHSPVEYVRAKNQARRIPEMAAGMPGGPYLRKAPSHFGWDWGPVLPTLGIWRPVSLQAWDSARLEDIHLRQEHLPDGSVNLEVQVEVEAWSDQPLSLCANLRHPGGTAEQPKVQVAEKNARITFHLTSPQLWYPNGLGDQPLYQLQVQLCTPEVIVDERSFQVGLRKLELVRKPDAWGESFGFTVNGIPLFAKGSNWIPADSFPSRLTPQRYEFLLSSAAQAHQNMLRVWGGGYYEDEAFYDLCDRLGILVWQDFMFACAYAPLDDPAYMANLRSEVHSTVRRLRHRACLALWCGNNEVNLIAGYAGWGKKNPELGRRHEEFFYHLLPSWISEDDPDTAYWASSPCQGKPGFDPKVTAGDTHNWEVFHMLRPFSFYRKLKSRFVSEFGFTALPDLRTIEAFVSVAARHEAISANVAARNEATSQSDELQLFSKTMLHHQRSQGGNDKITYYLADRFLIPKSFTDMVYLSQVLQAEGIRTGVEHWRRQPEKTRGALYWQLNDCWPVVSWSSIDYYGRWKALHYASRRFYAPILLSIAEDAHHPEIHVSNDTALSWQGEMHWSLETLQGTPIKQGSLAVDVPASSSQRVAALDFSRKLDHRQRGQAVLVCELLQDGLVFTRRVMTFLPEKALHLPDPALQVTHRVKGELLEISIKAQALARFVEVRLKESDAIFSDNYFDLPAGREITITCPKPQGKVNLLVRSLADSKDSFSRFSTEIQRRLAFLNAVLGMYQSLRGN
jgi:beta-mannosidase